jgi:hypothetical protein
VAPEDVVHVLSHMVGALKPGGIVLDLQVIRPNPRVESGGRLVCELDGTPLFAKADAALAAVEAAVAAGTLVEQARDDHDVLKHYDGGADLVDDLARSERRPIGIPEAEVRALAGPCVTRERCRLRRLRRAV